jgi:tetratricopeptide (TPR) repeat protein
MNWTMNWTLPSVRVLVIAGVVTVVVLAGAAGGWYWYDSQQRRIAGMYAEVMTRVYAAQSPQSPADARAQAQKELEQLLTQHPSAAPVAEAAYELGNLRYAARQWAPARSAYEIALARGRSATVRTLARTSIGYTWEAEQNWGKAIDAYGALARDLAPRDFLFDDVQFALARAQELGGKPADAVATYQRLLKDEPNGLRSEEAKQQLLRLGGTPAK